MAAPDFEGSGTQAKDKCGIGGVHSVWLHNKIPLFKLLSLNKGIKDE